MLPISATTRSNFDESRDGASRIFAAAMAVVEMSIPMNLAAPRAFGILMMSSRHKMNLAFPNQT